MELAGSPAWLYLAIFIASVFALDRILGVRSLPDEPPYIPTPVPYFGHLVNLLRFKMQYYIDLSRRYGLPIYSLAMPGGKIYVVTDPALLMAIQKMPKIFSFWAMEAKLSNSLAAPSKEAAAIMVENVSRDDGEKSMFIDGMRFTHEAVRLGESLDDMNQNMADALRQSIRQLDDFSSEEKAFDLWVWIKHAMTQASTQAIYGPDNPFRDPKVEQGFWNFCADTMYLLSGVFPQLIASKGYHGRETVVKAFDAYFAANGQQKASALVQGRCRIQGEYGVKRADCARFESINGIAILANTVPTAFWTIHNAFAYPDALDEQRAVAEELISEIKTPEGKTIYQLPLKQARDHPRILSHLHESMRHAGAGSTTRVVMEDIHLADRYFLKKDTFLICPARAIHFDESTWGPTAGEFQSDRFSANRGGSKIPQGAFGGFDGGATLCPGRFFSSTEIIALLLTTVVKFDLKRTEGRWGDIVPDGSNMTLAVAPPLTKIPISIIPRAEWQHREIELAL